MPTEAAARKRTTTASRTSSARTSTRTTGRAAASRKKSTEPTELDAVPVRESFTKGFRRFICPEEIKETYEKHYESLPRDVKLLRFAQGSLGPISDCYIMYAISLLGFADRETIFGFLHAIRRVNKELYIPDIADNDSAAKRLANLYHSGFLFMHQYFVPGTDKEDDYDTYAKLYSITSDGIQFMNQQLGKRVVENRWLQAKPLQEVIGWACASYVAVCIANQNGFHEFNQGLYRTRDIGTVIMPPVVKTELNEAKEHPAYISVIPAYLRFDPSYQAKNDYKDVCYRFVNTISQYFYNNDVKNRYGRVVVVVEDDDDLMEAASWIHKTGNLKEHYPRIFFTAEGALRSTGKLDGNFLCMREDPSDPNSFNILPAQPDFIRLS